MNRVTVPASTRLPTVLLSVFPAVVVVLSVMNHDTYSGVSQAMSELVLGPGGWLMTVAFVSLGAGSVLLARDLWTAVSHARAAAALLALTGILDLVSAAFHTTTHGQPDTTSSTIHQIAGVLTFLILIAVMFATAVAFRRDRSWRWFAGPTLVWAVLAVGAFFLVPILGDDRFGLAQRIFVGVVLSWLITLSILLGLRPTRAVGRSDSATARDSSRVVG